MNRTIVKILLLTLFIVWASGTDSFSQGKSGKNKNKKYKAKESVGPPPWAPAHGYRAKTRYVFFKDHDVYYDNEKGVYISVSGKGWEVSAKLPSILKGIDLKAAAKIDLNYSGDRPQKYYDRHKKKYQ
ncbi:hypothetical protein JMN32_01765 [Fulvivirga sp. 29W222]|uniref:Uncharacterized protein n=1 Tax=Fulvivirga marina TaxID=2494733 RepID=A0A937FV04_9BACT|nr:hypothetical protein [Fulvivirga marina]MBL6445017.1 hypothetical protein [Fulvivirga marina]